MFQRLRKKGKPERETVWTFILSQGGSGKLDVGVFGIVLSYVAGEYGQKAKIWGKNCYF